MSAFTSWASLDEAGFAAARFLLAALWQSSILFATIAALARLLRKRRARARHALWVAALCVAPLLPVLAALASGVGAPQAPLGVLPPYEASALPEPAFLAPTPGLPFASVPPVETPPFSPFDYPWALLGIAYVAGLAAFLTWMTVGRVRIQWWIRSARPATDARLLAAFADARQSLSLRRSTRVLESPDVVAPLTAGALRAVVLLPEGLGVTLSDADLAAVALHETAHVARRDPLVLSVVALVRTLLFFHPFVWLAARRVSLLAETACDDAVLATTGEPVGYARMLARFAENLPRRALSTEVAAGIVLAKSSFLCRIESILSHRRDRIRKLSRWAMVAILAGVVLSMLFATCVPLGEKDTSQVEALLCRSHLRGLMLGIQYYRNDHGDWPDTVDAFFQKYVAHKPHESMQCPTTGEPYRYVKPPTPARPDPDVIVFHDAAAHLIGKGRSQKKLWNVIFWSANTDKVSEEELKGLLARASEKPGSPTIAEIERELAARLDERISVDLEDDSFTFRTLTDLLAAPLTRELEPRLEHLVLSDRMRGSAVVGDPRYEILEGLPHVGGPASGEGVDLNRLPYMRGLEGFRDVDIEDLPYMKDLRKRYLYGDPSAFEKAPATRSNRENGEDADSMASTSSVAADSVLRFSESERRIAADASQTGTVSAQTGAPVQSPSLGDEPSRLPKPADAGRRGPTIAEMERELAARLDERISVDLEDASFKAFMDLLEGKGLRVSINITGLRRELGSLDRIPLTLKLVDVKVSEALDAATQQTGLAWRTQYGIVMIATRGRIDDVFLDVHGGVVYYKHLDRSERESPGQRAAGVANRLKTKISVDFNDTPLPEALNVLGSSGVRIFLNAESIEKTYGAVEDVALTLKLDDVSVENALDVIGRLWQLDWMVVGDAVRMSTKDDIERRKRIRKQELQHLKDRAWALINESKYDEAIEMLQRVLDKDPDDVEAKRLVEPFRLEQKRNREGGRVDSQVEGGSPRESIREEIRDVMDRLKMKISFDFQDAPITEVKKVLESSGINIVLDVRNIESTWGSLESVTVTLTLNEVTVENALGLICELTELRWAIHNGIVFVTVEDGEEIDRVERRIYRTDDLAQTLFRYGAYDGGRSSVGPAAKSDLMALAARRLAQMIRRTVTPDVWQKTGNTITPLGVQLIITAPHETHQAVKAFLESLREGEQVLVESRIHRFESRRGADEMRERFFEGIAPAAAERWKERPGILTQPEREALAKVLPARSGMHTLTHSPVVLTFNGQETIVSFETITTEFDPHPDIQGKAAEMLGLNTRTRDVEDSISLTVLPVYNADTGRISTYYALTVVMRDERVVDIKGRLECASGETVLVGVDPETTHLAQSSAENDRPFWFFLTATAVEPREKEAKIK